MKLVHFLDQNEEIEFGIIVEDYAISFKVLQELTSNHNPFLNDIDSYLKGLPESQKHAHKLYSSAKNEVFSHHKDKFQKLTEIRLVSPIPHPPIILDCGVSPKHLLNSGYTLIEHEFKGLIKPLIKKFLNRALNKTTKKSTIPYYKCNHLSISGPNEVLVWPSYTSYLDVEPELGIVVGHEKIDSTTQEKKTTIVGYVIMNDVSARDVQFPDFRLLCGPAKSKDFDKSMGIGPYFVTVDEIDNPLSLDVSVNIGKEKRLSWNGTTSEYTSNPQEVIDYLGSIMTLPQGSIIGMGTIPSCCGLDNDEWLLPGEKIEISIQGLGTLRQFIPDKLPLLEKSRWEQRKELNKYYMD